MNHFTPQTILFRHGITATSLDWELNEEKPVGFCRIYYVKNAAAVYEDEFETVPLQPGMLYVLPSALPYRARLTGGVPFKCLFFDIDIFPHAVTRLIKIKVQKDSALQHCLTAMEICVTTRSRDLLMTLLSVFPCVMSESPYYSTQSPFMQEATKFINLHLNEEISITRLAGYMKYHPNYFISLFSKESGYTPHQYIQKLRMQKACSLLLSGARVAEVSAVAGYSDPASFTRAFKAMYDTTPLKYAQSGASQD